MFDMDDAVDQARIAYIKETACLLSKLGQPNSDDTNDVDTTNAIVELSEEFVAWREEWDNASELNDDNDGAFVVFVNTFSVNTKTSDELQDAIANFNEYFLGYKTARDYAEDMIDESGELSGLSDLIRDNIDYYGIAQDLTSNGDITYEDGFLFRSNW